MRNEGKIREDLAAFFLSMPPADRQTENQRARYRNALRRMAQIETVSLLQSAFVKRPLRYGDVNALLFETLRACRLRLGQKNITLEYSAPENSVCAAAEPRLLTGAVVRLIGAAVLENPRNTVFANVTHNENSILISVRSEKPIIDATALMLVRAAARLHKGGVAVSGGTVGFSVKRGLPGAVGFFDVRDALDILDNPLSHVNLTFPD